MFALTPRLMLRPGWPEDAPILAEAIAHEQVARMTSRVPWPYALADAKVFLAIPRDDRLPNCLVFERGTEPKLVGGVGLHRAPDGEDYELGYWLTPSAWGRGYATEAARAMLDHARHGLGAPRVHAGHSRDNPASGRVLRKLGFEATGAVIPFGSLARGGGDMGVRYLIEFAPAPLTAYA